MEKIWLFVHIKKLLGLIESTDKVVETEDREECCGNDLYTLRRMATSRLNGGRSTTVGSERTDGL